MTSVVSVLALMLAFVGATSVRRATKNLAAPNTCQICESVVMAAHMYAEWEQLNATALDAQLSKVCAFLPMSYQSQCNVMVSAFGLAECQCITQATASFNATACCADVALCASLSASTKQTTTAAVSKPSECDVCESAATTANIITQYEGWNASVLASKLNLVCGFVPMQYQMQCQTIIQTFGQIECQCITDPKFNAQLCCSQVGVCPAPPLAVVKTTQRVRANNVCSSCKVVATAVHYIAQVAGINGTVLDSDLTAICQYVPSEYEAECEDVIAVGGQEVADCVTNSTTFDAQTCCYEADLCDKPSRVPKGLKLRL